MRIHGHYEKAKCDLEARAGRLYAKLDAVAAENEWPNNALRARILRLLGRLNVAMLEKDAAAISAAWPEFFGILTDARNLGEYDASQLLKLIDAVGGVPGNDPAYNALVEDVASFVSERTGEAEGALVLLKRAQQLDLDDHFDMIRLLGRAARQ